MHKQLAQITVDDAVAAVDKYCAEPQPGGDDDDTHVPLVVSTKLVLQTVQTEEVHVMQLVSVPEQKQQQSMSKARAKVKMKGNKQAVHVTGVEVVAAAER